MRPILMIQGLKNLHDARYCAAVGISMASFDLRADSNAALTPGFVKEIVEWLSGLEGVGEFGYEPGAVIEERARAAGLSVVMLPFDYDLDEAGKINLPMLFAISSAQLGHPVLAQMQAISERFPDALFLWAIDQANQPPLSSFVNAGALVGKCILRYDDPDAIYRQLQLQGLQPYGFSLGAFSADETGQLDYDACDAFIQAYQGLVPA